MRLRCAVDYVKRGMGMGAVPAVAGRGSSEMVALIGIAVRGVADAGGRTNAPRNNN